MSPHINMLQQYCISMRLGYISGGGERAACSFSVALSFV